MILSHLTVTSVFRPQYNFHTPSRVFHGSQTECAKRRSTSFWFLEYFRGSHKYVLRWLWCRFVPKGCCSTFIHKLKLLHHIFLILAIKTWPKDKFYKHRALSNIVVMSSSRVQCIPVFFRGWEGLFKVQTTHMKGVPALPQVRKIRALCHESEGENLRKLLNQIRTVYTDLWGCNQW